MTELTEIHVGSELWAMAFSAKGKHLIIGYGDGIRVWGVEDGKGIARMRSKLVNCLAVSKDDQWIAAGTWMGGVVVWSAKTYRQVFAFKEDDNIHAVDFSPDSTKLIEASYAAATVWDIATGNPLGSLHHQGEAVVAVKYSPKGDQIATATEKAVRIWDSNSGRLLVDIQVKVNSSQYNTGLLWFNNHIFVVSGTSIKQLDASTGSTVAEWPISGSIWHQCMTIPQTGEFIAYSTKTTVTVWDTFTRTQLALIQHPQDIFSIIISPGDQFLAIGGKHGKISIQSLSALTDSIPVSRLHCTFQEPEIQIHNAALESWKNNELDVAEVLLTTSIIKSQDPTHLALASRSLVRARMQRWDAALVDAEMAIDIQPSVIGYVAKSVAHIGNGERDKGYRTCDIAFERFHTSHVTFLLLVKAIIVCMAGEHLDAISRIDDLIATVPFNSMCYTVQAYMYLLLGNLQMEQNDYRSAIQSLERAKAQIRHYGDLHLRVVSLIFGWKFDNLGVTIRQRLCEALYGAGRTKDAGECLFRLVNTVDKVYMSVTNAQWVADFAHRYLSTPKSDGDLAAKAVRNDEATMPRAKLHPPNPAPFLKEWTKASLLSRSWKDTLAAATDFMVPRLTIYQMICEHLETVDRIIDASQCFRGMADELAQHANVHQGHVTWVLNFRNRCSGKLERLGDTAVGAGQHRDAVSYYSAALALDPTVPQAILIKRSNSHLLLGSLEAALDDANKVIEVDPFSPWGYEGKHAALHSAGDYKNAITAFETMLSKMSQSSDPEILERHRRYADPGETRLAIRRAIQDAFRDSPRVLINTVSGRLLDQSQQAAAFESSPVFDKLISSTTANIDHARIQRDVTEYYRYAMFSHKWEDNEPLFEKALPMVVYDLDDSVTHNKLKTFCKLVRGAGLQWAWSDTCCINKADHFVLQEALVSMFKWYQGSALTLVLLRGVRSPSRRGDLVRSVWNTRAWTFQEYHASKVVRFYHDDWTLYRDLDVPNHKESPEIVLEMERATGISARALTALRPGLDNIREKLCLASTRQTTFVEDAAYSLFGIFSVSLPIVYGEGDQALGRLLAQLLTSSGDTDILAWTGRSGSFNSCLPANIISFKELPTSHIPSGIASSEMEKMVAAMRSSSINVTLAMKLREKLDELPVPWFVGQRMKLSCLAFRLGPVSETWSASRRVFRAMTDALGTVEIGTTEDLAQLDSLILVHPWIDFLLDRHPVGSVMEPTGISKDKMEDQSPSTPTLPISSNASLASSQSRTARIASRLGISIGARHPARDAASLLPPMAVSLTDKRTQALEVVVRLRQPFGALLLTPTRHNVAEYRRVGSEGLVRVRVQEDTPLNVLISGVQTLDVL